MLRELGTWIKLYDESLLLQRYLYHKSLGSHDQGAWIVL